MGTQVQCKSYLPGYYSMRDLNEDSNSSSWPRFYGERNLTNGQYCNGYVPSTIAEAYPGYDKDQLKQKMLEHEAVFKNQVFELHRLYRIQRDMMEEIKRTESNKRQMSIEPSSSSSLLGSQKPAEDAGKWHAPSFLMSNSGYPRPSVSGAEIVNSPLYCTKGNDATPGRADGSASKDCEILETRPSKVRKKLFDLQLPADEYIDTEEGEQLLGSKVAEISSSLPNGNHKATPEKFGNFFLNGEKFTAQMNASASTACLRSTTRLADLNEPIQVEDDPVPSSVNFLGYPANHGKSNALNFHSGSNSETAGLHKGVALNAHLVNHNGTSGAISVINKSSERDWLSGMHESGEGFYPGPVQRGNSMISPPPGFHHSPKVTVPSQPTQVRANRPHPPLGIPPTEEMWRGRTVHGLENVDRGFGNSNGNHLSSAMTSHLPGLYSLGNTSDVATSWSHSALSWGKPASSLSQKMGSLHAYPSLQSSSLYSTSANSSSQSHGILGDKLHNIESSKMNGFYHGSSSGSKEILGRYPPNCNGHFTTESSRFLKPVKDMDLNVVLTKCPSDEVVCLQDLEVMNGNSNTERDLKGLPWLRAKPSCKSEAANVRIDINSGLFQASPNKSVWESEPVKDLNKLPTQEDDVEITGVKKIMGVAIFEKPAHFRNESSFLPKVKKNSLIDINVAYDEQIASEALADEKTAVDVKVANNNNNTRSFIDLNCCVPEDDEELSVLPVAPSVAANNNNAAKILMEIDLEAPAQESEDEVQVLPEASLKSATEPELGQENDEEVAKTAAEYIVELSMLSCDSCPVIQIEDDTCLESGNPSSECLLWLAEAASRGEMDDFEIMSLQIEEVKEEDFLPKPFIPEALKVEESAANAAPNRTRKGQSRRGRPRRDFQRDILPGLASLSRHEVTEDLQTFGGLMRATGQPWNSTLTRRTGTRNGGGRGRRRAVVADAAPAAPAPPPPPPLVQQRSTPAEGGLEDRSLTGWGKTTRRPRRQRCPGGNPPQAALLT